MFQFFSKAQQQNKLPADFADQLLDLELESESPDLNIDTVTKLLQLYSQAVEYYSSIKSDKYLVFKNKSQALIMKPNVMALLNGNTKQEKNSFQIIQMDKKDQVQQFLNNAKESHEKVTNLIQDDFKLQDQKVQQRIMQRIKDPAKVKHAMSKSNSLKSFEIPTQPIKPMQVIREHSAEANDHRTCKTENDVDEVIPEDQIQIITNVSNQKSKKVREIINRNQNLKKQKSELQNQFAF